MIAFCRVSRASKLLGDSSADKWWAFVNCMLEYSILHLLSCVYICLCFRTQLTEEEGGPHSHPHPCPHWFHASIHDFNRAFILESEKCFVFHVRYRESKEEKKMSSESVCKGWTVCRTCSWTDASFYSAPSSFATHWDRLDSGSCATLGNSASARGGLIGHHLGGPGATGDPTAGKAWGVCWAFGTWRSYKREVAVLS